MKQIKCKKYVVLGKANELPFFIDYGSVLSRSRDFQALHSGTFLSHCTPLTKKYGTMTMLPNDDNMVAVYLYFKLIGFKIQDLL